MSIEVIAALIQICKDALSAGRGLRALIDEKYTDQEEEILIAGAADGLFQIVTISSVPILFANCAQRTFDSETDAAIGAEYLEGFRRLCHRGLVVPADDEMFQLTGSGFAEARRLAKKQKKA